MFSQKEIIICPQSRISGFPGITDMWIQLQLRFPFCSISTVIQLPGENNLFWIKVKNTTKPLKSFCSQAAIRFTDNCQIRMFCEHWLQNCRDANRRSSGICTWSIITLDPFQFTTFFAAAYSAVALFNLKSGKIKCFEQPFNRFLIVRNQFQTPRPFRRQTVS